MKKTYLIVLLTSMLFLGNTCYHESEDCHKTIGFFNNSEKAVYVLESVFYPDSLVIDYDSNNPYNSNPFSANPTSKVLAKSSSNNPLWDRDCYEIIFNSGTIIPSDTLMVYVFDAEVIENEKWSTIVKEYKVLKRYDLSLDDLKRMNWRITYP